MIRHHRGEDGGSACGEVWVSGFASMCVRAHTSKDHRPDLKQLLFVLTTAADGGAPVHFRCADGNTSDSVPGNSSKSHPRCAENAPRQLNVTFNLRFFFSQRLPHLVGELSEVILGEFSQNMSVLFCPHAQILHS